MSNKNETLASKFKTIIIATFITIVIFVCFGGIFMAIDLLTPNISIAKPVDNSENTACLYIQRHLTLVSFNGQKIRRTISFFSRAAAVNIPAGQNTLIFDYHKERLGSSTTAEGFQFNSYFESGKYYYVNWDRNLKENKISVYISETLKGVYRDPSKKENWYDIFIEFFW